MSAAFFAALAAVALAPLCRRMAAPYAAPARAVPAQVASFYPGDANGSQFVNVDDSRLLQAQRLFEGEIQGPESVAVSADGNRLVLLDRFGYVRVAQRGREGYKLEAEAFYMGPGRPLGFALLEHDAWADAELIVCDSLKGLVRVRPFGSILARMEVLTNVDEDSLPFFYANDVAVRGSKMYFTSSTNVSVLLRDEAYDTMGAYLLNALSGQQDGRLLVYDVETRTTKTLVRGIAYANGVAVPWPASSSSACQTRRLPFNAGRRYLRTARLWPLQRQTLRASAATISPAPSEARRIRSSRGYRGCPTASRKAATAVFGSRWSPRSRRFSSCAGRRGGILPWEGLMTDRCLGPGALKDTRARPEDRLCASGECIL